MKNKNTLIVFVVLFTLVLLSRWSSHLWNFTLVGGAFIFAGSYFQDKKIAVALILSSMLASDFIIGFHNQMLSVYFAFLVMMALGFWLKSDSGRLKIFGFSLAGSFLFYVITNFAVWMGGGLYPMTFEGLIQCYVMAIPFYRNQLLGDVISTLVFFEAANQLRSFSENKVKA